MTLPLVTASGEYTSVKYGRHFLNLTILLKKPGNETYYRLWNSKKNTTKIYKFNRNL